VLAELPLEDDGFKGTGVAYDLSFDSGTRFYLNVDSPGYHVQIPYDIIASPSGRYPYTITHFIATSDNITVHSRCELRVGARQAV
jgi:hypothetical protein